MAGSRIGENVTIFPNAVLYENTVVGDAFDHPCRRGARGLWIRLRPREGSHRLTAQLGNVVLGADVDIGAGTTSTAAPTAPRLSATARRSTTR